MKKFRRITAIVIALIILLTANAQAAYNVQDKVYGDFTYKVLNNQAIITSYKGTKTSVSIPEYIGSYPVTEIGESAFENKSNITEVILPDSLTTIGRLAFVSCRGITSITLPESLKTIGTGAFEYCKFTNITIPDSVESIGNKAFGYCSSLISFVMPNKIKSCDKTVFEGCRNVKFAFFTGDSNNHLEYSLFTDDNYRPEAFYKVDTDYCLEDYVLFDKNKTTLVAYGRTDKFYTIPDSVKIIDQYAFEKNTTLLAIELPKGLKNIKARAFAEIPTLLYVSIPSSVSLIESGAFYNCTNLREVHYGGDSAKWSTMTISTGNTPFVNALKKYNSDLAFDTENLVVFTKDMKTLLYYHPNQSLSDARIRTYSIPDTVTEIAAGAFKDSDELLYITIPDSVLKIGRNAFYNCTLLKAVYAGNPENWCKIHFEDTYANPMYYSDAIFFNEETLTEFTVPESVTEIQNYSFYNIKTLKKVTMHDGVTKIGSYAFYNCSVLENVTLGNSLTEISKNAFYGCKALKEITLPDSLIYLRDYAFSGSGIEHISINNTATIEFHVFERCTSLKSACLPENECVSIPYGMFNGCTSLETVYIPSNIKELRNNAFYNCKALTSVYFGGTEEEWNKIKIDSTNTDLWLATIYFEHEHTIDNWTVVTPGGEFTDGVETGTCTQCGYKARKVTPSTHVHKYTATTTPATCLKAGATTYTCTCNDSYTEEIPATGHKVITVPGKDPTCTEPGYTECKKCSVCDAILSTFLEIPANNHSEGEWVVVIEAEIGKEGKEQQKCTVCSAILNERVIPALPEEPSTKPEEPSTKPEEPSTKPEEPSTSYLIGDVTGDGKVNAIDARIILRISAQLENLEDYYLPFSVFDITGDGKVNALDARKALRIAAKLE